MGSKKVKPPKTPRPVDPALLEEAQREARRRYSVGGRASTTFAGRLYGASRGVMGDAVAAMAARPRTAGGY